MDRLRFNLRFLLLMLWGVAARLSAAEQPAVNAKTDSLRRVVATAKDTVRIKALYALTEQVVDQNSSEAMAYAQQALAEAKKIGWQWGEARAVENIGWLYTRKGDYSQAQQRVLAARSLWEKIHQEDGVLRTTCRIALIMAESKQFAKAIKWGEKALQGATIARDTAVLTRACTIVSMCLSSQHRPAAALPYILRTLEIVEKLHRKRNSPQDLIQRSIPLEVALNNVADAYLALNQPKVALNYLFKALRLERGPGRDYDISVVEATLAQVYMKLGKDDMAIYHALQARHLSEKAGRTSVQIISNDLLDTLYTKQGNHQLARQYVAENRVLENKVRIQEQERKVAEKQSQYETQEKERNIQLLTQQNQIAKLAALQQRTLRNAAIISSLLLLLAVGVLFTLYRQRQRTVRLLDEQNREKELLLREVHHRVKNNLQIVLSLLNNQLEALPDPVAADAIRESQSRVQTMALIHQNLYQSNSLARIDMRRYLAELLDAIGRAFQREEVEVTFDVAPVQLTTTTAVPLGLVVNELVTNAYKYAFTGCSHNQLHVGLQPAGPNTYCLVVADNGVGLPLLDLEAVQSLGLRLTVGLLRQLHAQFTISRTAGTRFTITFHELSSADSPGVRQPTLVHTDT